MDASEKKKLSNKVIWLAWYPDNEAKQFKCYVINGLKFHTKDFEATRKIQNSGVCVVTEGDATYYGVLIDIIELNYSDKYRYVYSNVNGLTLLVGEDAKKMSLDFSLSIFHNWYTRAIDWLTSFMY